MPHGMSFREYMRHNGKYVAKFQAHQQAVNEAYWKVHEEAMRPGALDKKTKELIALSIIVAKHCDVCITFHIRDCVRAGCTDDEIMETLSIAVMEGDGPTMVYAGNAVEALEEYRAAEAKAGKGAKDTPADEQAGG